MTKEQWHRALKTQLARNMRATSTLGLTIPSRIMLEAIYNFGGMKDAGGSEHEWARKVVTLLSDSIMEAWRLQPPAVSNPGMILQQQVKSYLLDGYVARPGREGRPIMLTCLAGVHLLNTVIDRGDIILAEDSAGHEAITMIIDSINDSAELRDSMNRSAEKTARRWLKSCEDLKIYRAQ